MKTLTKISCIRPFFDSFEMLLLIGAAMLAPLVNPYDSSMTKQEMSRTWENWNRRRRLLFYLARRFPKFLSYFYHQTFLSGKHGQIQNWLSLTLGKKVISTLPSNISLDKACIYHSLNVKLMIEALY